MPLGEGVVSNGVRARGILPPPSKKAASFFHQYRDVVLVEGGAEGLPVARFQRLSGGAVFPEQDHAAVQAFHVELAVGVDAFRPERGPQAIVGEPFPNVFFEQVVARARLDFQERLCALDPCEYRAAERVVFHSASAPKDR